MEMSRTMRSVWWTVLLVAALATASASVVETSRERIPSFSRALQDEMDWSQYSIRQGHCFRMKIVADNDDDGNSYFYNGAYRAQYKRYISYLVCPATNEASNANGCHEYVSGLEDYLEQTVPYVQTYCGVCSATCNNRRLEDAQNAENENAQMTVDCSTCVTECKLLTKGNSGTDESAYIGCQANNGQDGEEEMQYYTAPQCENDQVVIGHFYDDECTIKTTTLTDTDFSYNTFETIAGLRLQCGNDGEDDTCGALQDVSISCEDAADQQEQSLCKAAASAGRVYTYYKQPFFKQVPVTLIAVLVGFVLVGFCFLAYTYFVRHARSNKSLIPMAELDHHTDLPPIS